MKTMSDFKGSKGNFIIDGDRNHTNSLGSYVNVISTDETDVHIAEVYANGDNDDEGLFNAKLFANSKKMLEGLITAREHIYMSAFTQASTWGCETDKAKEFAENHLILKHIDKLINDSL